MTGFGRSVAAIGNYTLTIQVSSVNRKTLDLTMSLPTEWEELEAPAGELVRKHAVRGKVNVRVDVTGSDSSAAQAFTWDEVAVDATVNKLAAQAARRGVQLVVTSELLWSIAGAQRKKVELPSGEEVQQVVLSTLEEALKAFVGMRAKEGAALLADFTARMEIIASHINDIAGLAPQVALAWREQLLKRLREAAGLAIDVQDERVLREVALFADRCDITEELTRLRSHLVQFHALLRSDGEIGRKAEFILQEIGREVNTIGSKANNFEISRRVIELKNELERIREQIANVE